MRSSTRSAPLRRDGWRRAGASARCDRGAPPPPLPRGRGSAANSPALRRRPCRGASRAAATVPMPTRPSGSPACGRAVLARPQARMRAAGRPLWGVPFAVKDNIDVAGLPTTAACPGFAYTARDQRAGGAAPAGCGRGAAGQDQPRSVRHRSGWHALARTAFRATCSTRLRVPGGSSSGSACAVAAGIVPFALGTDTAGSGRVPAAFGNIVGLKPTVGSVPTRGMVPACRSIDTISVFARSVDEALAVQRVIAGFDPDDAYSRRPPFAHLRRGAAPPHVRASPWPTWSRCATPKPRRCTRRRRSIWAPRRSTSRRSWTIARLLYDGPWVAERTAALRLVIEEQPDILHPGHPRHPAKRLRPLRVDAFDAFHRLAETKRAAERLFQAYDALLLPTAPFCPTLAEVHSRSDRPEQAPRHLHQLRQSLRPGRLRGAGGLRRRRLAGRRDIARAGLVRGPPRRPGRHRCTARSPTTVGATGQPLPPAAAARSAGARRDRTVLHRRAHGRAAAEPSDHRLGGRFLRVAHTAPAYRLFALGNRPGMLRAADGAAIAGEVWALPTAAIGTSAGAGAAAARLRHGGVARRTLPRLPCGGGRHRGCARYHPLRRLARLAAGEQGAGRVTDTTDLDALYRCRHGTARHSRAAGMARCGPAASGDVVRSWPRWCSISRCRTRPIRRRCSAA